MRVGSCTGSGSRSRKGYDFDEVLMELSKIKHFLKQVPDLLFHFHFNILLDFLFLFPHPLLHPRQLLVELHVPQLEPAPVYPLPTLQLLLHILLQRPVPLPDLLLQQSFYPLLRLYQLLLYLSLRLHHVLVHQHFYHLVQVCLFGLQCFQLADLGDGIRGVEVSEFGPGDLESEFSILVVFLEALFADEAFGLGLYFDDGEFVICADRIRLLILPTHSNLFILYYYYPFACINSFSALPCHYN